MRNEPRCERARCMRTAPRVLCRYHDRLVHISYAMPRHALLLTPPLPLLLLLAIAVATAAWFCAAPPPLPALPPEESPSADVADEAEAEVAQSDEGRAAPPSPKDQGQACRKRGGAAAASSAGRADRAGQH